MLEQLRCGPVAEFQPRSSLLHEDTQRLWARQVRAVQRATQGKSAILFQVTKTGRPFAAATAASAGLAKAEFFNALSRSAGSKVHA